MRALEFIRDHVTFKLPYDFSYQMKTPMVRVDEFLELITDCLIPMRSVTNYVIEWMGLNFDVFPGFQQIPCYA